MLLQWKTVEVWYHVRSSRHITYRSSLTQEIANTTQTTAENVEKILLGGLNIRSSYEACR